MDILEILAAQSVVDMKYPVVNVPERALSYSFMAAEALWILSGDNRVETIKQYAPSIAAFSDNGVTFFGAYGPKINEQIGHVTQSLAKDRDTRQSVINIWRENPPETKDVPCTLSAQWFIRDGALHCVDTMRSSDIWLGWPYDVFNFTALSAVIGLRLRDSFDVHVRLGTLYLNAGSQHLYRKNYDKALACIDRQGPLERMAPLDLDTFTSENDFIRHLEEVRDNEPRTNDHTHFLKEVNNGQ